MLTKISNKNMHVPSIFTHESTVMQHLSLMKKWAFDMTSYYEAHFWFEIENLKKVFYINCLKQALQKNMQHVCVQ